MKWVNISYSHFPLDCGRWPRISLCKLNLPSNQGEMQQLFRQKISLCNNNNTTQWAVFSCWCRLKCFYWEKAQLKFQTLTSMQLLWQPWLHNITLPIIWKSGNTTWKHCSSKSAFKKELEQIPGLLFCSASLFYIMLPCFLFKLSYFAFVSFLKEMGWLKLSHNLSLNLQVYSFTLPISNTTH